MKLHNIQFSNQSKVSKSFILAANQGLNALEKVSGILGSDIVRDLEVHYLGASHHRDFELNIAANGSIDIMISGEPSASDFAYIWALAFVNKKNTVNVEGACNAFLHKTIPAQELRRRISAKWSQAEIGIQSTLQSIMEDNSDNDNIVKVQLAINSFHGSLDTAMPLTSHETLISISRMQARVEDANGHIESEKSALLAMFVNLRAECVAQIEKTSICDDDAMNVPVAYLARIRSEASEMVGKSAALVATPVVLATLAARVLNQTYQFNEPKMNPTLDELKELESQIPTLVFALNGVQVQKDFDGDHNFYQFERSLDGGGELYRNTVNDAAESELSNQPKKYARK